MPTNLFVMDTDTLSLLQDRHPEVSSRFLKKQPSEMAVTVLTVEEQLSGWYTLIRRYKTQDRLAWAYKKLGATVRELCRVQILDVTESALNAADALLRMKLNVKKTDLRIGAVVLEHNATLITRNRRDFERIPSLRIEDWTIPDNSP